MNRFGIFLLSPPTILFAAWLMTAVGATLGYIFHDSMPILARAMREYRIDFNFPLLGVVWVSVGMGTFLLFSVPLLKRPGRPPQPGSSHALSTAVRVALAAYLFSVALILAWVGLAAARVGGVGALVQMAQSFEVDAARNVLRDNTFFTGMRLFYAGFMGFGIFGACIVAHNFRTGDRNRIDIAIGALMFMSAVVLLGGLSVILSQRLLAIQTVLGAFIGASVISGRLYGVKYAPFFILVLFVIWSAREAVTVGRWDPDANPAMVGLERLLFYFVNDFGNSVWPFQGDTPHTYGFFTFRFAIYFSLQDTYFAALLNQELRELLEFRGGGEFPIFTAPYIDFSYYGMIVIAFVAILFTYIFNRAHSSFFLCVALRPCRCRTVDRDARTILLGSKFHFQCDDGGLRRAVHAS